MKQISPLLALLLLAASARASPGECPVTLPSSSPVDVPKWQSTASYAWYGSEALAVLLPAQGRWKGMGPSRNFRDKFWIWRRGYDAETESRPALIITGVKLDDGDSPQRLRIDNATNAFGPGWSQMLVGMEFPSSGCWQVTASYTNIGITQDLTFVVDVINK